MAKLIEKAKLAEQAELFEDMVKVMTDFVKSGNKLSSDHRNLLSVGYKNVVGTRRSAWRVLSSLQVKHPSEVNKEYIKTVEKEVEKICKEVIDLLDAHLIVVPEKGASMSEYESVVFFMKMKGDYYRYLAEVKNDSERDEASEHAKKAYEKASKFAAEELSSTHPIRLGLALNFSVFFYEIQEKREDACGLAKEAFDNAIAELDQLKEDSYKDSTLIMQLLRDNLTLWTADTEANEEEEEDK